MTKLIVVTALFALAAAGCSEKEQGGIDAGGYVGADLLDDDQDSVTFAQGFTPYPGTESQGHTTAAGATMALLTTDAEQGAILDYYRAEAAAIGFKIVTDEEGWSHRGDVHHVKAERADGAEMNLSVTDTGEERTIDMAIRAPQS